MPTKLLVELRLLLLKRPMPVRPAPRINAPHGAAEAVARRLLLDDPVALPRPCPEVGEAQQVKRPRRFGRFSSIVIGPGARRTKRNEPRLGGVDRQAVLAKSFWKDFQNALGIATVSKPDHEIIRIADEESTVAQTGFHIAFEPQVQHIMQEEVRKQRRNYAALGRAGVRVADAIVLQHARLQPFTDEAQQHAVTHPPSKKRPQTAVIQVVEELADIHL